MSASGQVQMSALVMATSSFWVLFRGSGDCKCGKTAYSIVDSVGKAASSAADSAQVSTMSSVSDDLSVVVAGFNGRRCGSGNGHERAPGPVCGCEWSAASTTFRMTSF